MDKFPDLARNVLANLISSAIGKGLALLGAAVLALFVILTHSLEWWRQAGIVALFAFILVAWIIAASRSVQRVHTSTSKTLAETDTASGGNVNLARSAIVLRFSHEHPYKRRYKDPKGQEQIIYQLGLFNGGQVALRNTTLSLMTITPTPRASLSNNNFPLRLRGGREAADSITINSQDEEYYELLRFGKNISGQVMITGLQQYLPFAIEPDETWNLRLRASSADTEPQYINLIVRGFNDILWLNSSASASEVH